MHNPPSFQGKASMDGANLLWTFPKVLSPLVQPPIIDRGLRVGVEGRFLSNCVARHRGYQIEEQDGTVEIRIPFGAEGGYIKVQTKLKIISVFLWGVFHFQSCCIFQLQLHMLL